MQRSVRPAAARVLATSVLWRLVCVATLVITTHTQTAFDTSGTLLRWSISDAEKETAWDTWAVPFVRWDTVYFVGMAHPLGGYQYEQMLAFQPGIVGVLRLLGTSGSTWSPTRAVVRTALLANILSCVSPVLLYLITRTQFRSEKIATRAALLSIYAPASGTVLSSPTPEPFFSFLALLGFMHLSWDAAPHLARLCASVCFAGATLFRANGVLLSGFLVWHALWRPCLRRVPRTVAVWIGDALVTIGCVLLVWLPFVLQQAWAYAHLCPGRPWCNDMVPLPYSYIQAAYWDVGLGRYWTTAQVPNFVLATPVLGLGAWACVRLAHSWRRVWTDTWRPWHSAGHACELAYIYYTAAVLALLLFVSHVQIALRFATPGGLPLLWWGAALLRDEHPRMGRVFLGYLLWYSLAATVLYAGFYPPA